MHVEVRNPQGKTIEYYGTSLAIGSEPVQFSVPLALSDPVGRWRVTVREPFAHQTAAADFVVAQEAQSHNASQH
jgi:hypothetical protein